MGAIAVIDTETNWIDQVMSIGIVVADGETYRPLDARYYVFEQECQIGGMYERALYPDGLSWIITDRLNGLEELAVWMKAWDVTALFAYNANFDRNHLPEFGAFQWFDIMRLAAYRQYNPTIPPDAECCATGRLKRGYGVEPTLRRLSGDMEYRETHNALFDARDELEILRLLGHPLDQYIPL